MARRMAGDPWSVGVRVGLCGVYSPVPRFLAGDWFPHADWCARATTATRIASVTLQRLHAPLGALPVAAQAREIVSNQL